MVSDFLTKHVVLEEKKNEDFGGIVEDLILSPEYLASPYEIRKNIRALRATVHYGVGVHGTVNK